MLDRFFSYMAQLRAGDRFVLLSACLALLISGVFVVAQTSQRFLVDISTHGGVLTEGMIGTPRFINPVLAVTQIDKDLTRLTFAGLMRVDEKGELVPDLAEKVEVTDDGAYHITLRQNARFSDGTPVTTADIALTITRIQDPLIASPLHPNWDGVTLEIINERECIITLASPYPPFIENLTTGILPAHIWQNIPSERFTTDPHNTAPIGAGPFRYEDTVSDTNNVLQSMTLLANKYYQLGMPLLESVLVRFYQDDTALQAAFKAHAIESAGTLTTPTRGIFKTVRDAHTIERTLPYSYALFYNQNRSAVLRDLAVRDALATFIDRDTLVQNILGGAGVPLAEPVPAPFVAQTPVANRSENERLAEARRFLEGGGWTHDDSAHSWTKRIDNATTTLAFSVATLDSPITTATANALKDQLATLDIPLTVQTYDRGTMVANVLKQRDYDSVLYGTALATRIVDLYPFWHASQRLDPGLNIAQYANIDTDKALVALRTARTPEDRTNLYKTIRTQLTQDNPALFLFATQYTIAFPNTLEHVRIPEKIIDPSERFSLIHEWYREREYVWPIFVHNQ